MILLLSAILIMLFIFVIVVLSAVAKYDFTVKKLYPEAKPEHNKCCEMPEHSRYFITSTDRQTEAKNKL